MKSKKNLYLLILGVIAVLFLINVLAKSFFFRLDFTADQRYTLSQATKDILENLEEPVTVIAYFSEDLPPNIMKTRNDFKDLLVEFENHSDGNLVYEFINPNKDDKTEQEAMQAGISPVVINVRDKNQMKQQKAYLGAVVHLGEETEVIPFMQPGAAMEYALASAIKKIAVVDKPKIALVQGHGEPSMSELQQAASALDVLYDIQTVDLKDTANLAQFKTLAIVAPTDSFPDYQLQKLDNYLAQGKNLFIAMNRVDGDLQTLMGSSVNTQLEAWLKNKGLTVADNFVVDASCTNVSVRQQQGFFSFNTPVKFPYIPIVKKFADHPITKGIEAVMMKYVSNITYQGDTSLTFTPIAMSSDKSGTLPASTYFNIQKQWTEDDFPQSNLTVAAVLEGNIVGDKPSKIVLIGDGDFAVNGERGKSQQLQADNVSLLVNSIDWLSDDTGLIDLRTKGITDRPLDELKDSTKNMLKYLNFLIPVLLIIIYGIVRMQRKKKLRKRRMQKGVLY